MEGYVIRTAYGDTYKTDKDGYVLEYSNGLKKDKNSESRKTWQIIGAWEYTSFGRIRIISLAELLGNTGRLMLTNGKPRYGKTDTDHGTHRLQGNKEYHGITSISTY